MFQDPKCVLLERTNFCRGKLTTGLLYQNRIEKDFKLAEMITTGCLFYVFYIDFGTHCIRAKQSYQTLMLTHLVGLEV